MGKNNEPRSILDDFFQAAQTVLSRQIARLSPRNRLRYDTFEITDPDLAARICAWYGAYEYARESVSAFLDTHINDHFQHFGVLYGLHNCAVNEQGRIDRLTYAGTDVYRLPDGWGWQSDDLNTFLVPVDPDLQLALGRLPRVPTRAQLHEIVGWPTLPVFDRIDGFVNSLLRAHSDGQAVYIDAPRPDNFKKHPAIAKALERWFASGIPDGLRPVGAATGIGPGRNDIG